MADISSLSTQLISYGVIEQKFVTDDFLTNSSDRFIGGYYPNLDTLNWKDENIRREFEEHPELWF